MKRILSLVVSLALILSMVPAISLAAGAAEYTVVDKVPATIDTSNSYSPWGALYGGGWVPMMGTESGQPDGGAFCAWSDDYYAEIVSEGKQDIGALHIKSAASTVAVGINIGMTVGETYTLGMWVKGTTTNANKVLSLYGNGDGTIIGATEYSVDSVVASTTISDQWTYVERTFTATLAQLNLWAANWGENDIYIDNITVKNSAGVDLMAGYGDFYTMGEVIKDSDVTNELTENSYLDTSKSAGAYAGAEQAWVPMFPTGTPADSWSAWDAEHYAEIVANGYADAGSLHIVSAAGKNTGLAINAGMTAGETYTLSLWAKGTAQSQTLFSYANGDFIIIETAEALSNEWKQFTVTFTAGQSQLNLCCRDWGANDVYVDNITLTDASGNNLLSCAGNFCHKAVADPAVAATCTTAGLTEGKHCSVCSAVLVAQSEIPALGHSWGEAGKNGKVLCTVCGMAKAWVKTDLLDTTMIDDLYEAPSNKWVPFAPTASYQDSWPAWETGVNYGEIVEAGNKNAGALHLVSAGSKNTGVVINPGMTVGETYTLGLWVKGTASSNKMLAMYGNGDATLIGNPEYCGDVCLSTVPADWTYIEKSFTATHTCLAIYAADWGVSDLYIDNITLKNASGVDLLAGYGDFYTEIDPSLVADAITLDTSKLDDLYDAPSDQWVSFTPWANYQDSWPVWESGVNYGEIVEAGNKDAGSLHLVSAPSKNTGVVINPGMTVGETYTIGLWVKGTSTNPNRTLVLYGNSDGSIIGATEYSADGVVASTTISDQWTYMERSFTATHTCLAIFAADWGENDLYIDNITLKNASGVDLLAGNGDFCEYKEAVKAELMSIDTSVAYPSYGGAPTDRWSVMYETGEPTTYWPVWSSDRPYGEIVAEGYQDPGALHLASDGTKNAGAAIGVNMVSGQTYTLGLWAKGTSNSGKVLFTYGNSDAVIIGASQELSADWTYYEVTITADTRKQLNLVASDWGTTDVYIDHVTLKNGDGVDLLAGYGDFCKMENNELPNVPTDDVVSGTADAINTGKQSWDGLSHISVWTPFFPAGINADTGWTAWETEGDSYNYAEIAAIGKSDAGSLHFVHSDAYENVGVALEAGLVPGNTYTLKAYVKGYAKNTDGGLQMYANGDGMIAKFGYHQVAENNADWVEVIHTFVADRTALQIMVGGGTGLADIYLDDLRIIDSNGNNILGDKGSFSTTQETIPDLAVISSDVERAYRWYWNAEALGGVTLTPSVNNNVEIIAEGCEDAGALNIWQNDTTQDVSITLVNTMALDRSNNETYTLSMNVKGVFGNSGELLSVFPAYMTETEAKEQMNITTKLKEVLGITCGEYERFYVPEWTNIQFELPYNSGDNGFAYLVLKMSQYVWGSHFYIDNIQVLDPDGNDMLGGAGNFMDSGSESCPIVLPATGAEILNSNTMYYMAYVDSATLSVSNHVEYGYTAGDQSFSVTHNGVTQSASNKNVTMSVAPSEAGQPVIFSITSTASSMDVPDSMLEAAGRAEEFNIYDVVITDTSCSHSYGEWNVTTAPTYVAAGSQSKTCALCGDVVTEEIPVLENPVTGWSITLKDSIGVNFVMTLAETDVVAVTVNGSTVDCTVTDGKLSVNVAAAQMMDEITISVNGLPLANTYSVRKYADVILADSTKSDCHELVKNMLIYGGAAQTYFDYNSDNLASSGIEVTAVTPAGEATVELSDNLSGFAFYGATLVHETKIAVRFYFTGSTNGLSFTVGGDSVEAVEKNGMYYVEIAGINPQDLGSDVTVVVSNGTDSLTVSYSPLDYMIRMYNKADSTEATKAVAQALYGYYLAATAYTA